MDNENRGSTYAALYLGNDAEGLVPAYRDLSPEGVPLPDGTLVPWPEGAVFAVYFDGQVFEEARCMSLDTVDNWEFFGADGYPFDFPNDCRLPIADFKREFQVYPWGWRSWPVAELRSFAVAELGEPGCFARLNAQAHIVHAVVDCLPRPPPT